jgi:hypothetical protein
VSVLLEINRTELIKIQEFKTPHDDKMFLWWGVNPHPKNLAVNCQLSTVNCQLFNALRPRPTVETAYSVNMPRRQPIQIRYSNLPNF